MMFSDLRQSVIALAGLLLIVGAAVAATKMWWPTRDVVQLPGTTDTVTVTRAQLDTVWRERVRWRDRVTTDTLVVTDSVRITDTIRVAALEARWYLDSASIAQTQGDTSFYALTWLQADSTGVLRRDALESQITLGPVRQIALDSAGLHVDYGQFPRDEGGCGFGCRLSWAAGGTLAGMLITVLTP